MGNKITEILWIETEENKKYCKKLFTYTNILLILFLFSIFASWLDFRFLGMDYELLYWKILSFILILIIIIWIVIIPIIALVLYKKWLIIKPCFKRILIRWLTPIIIPLLVYWWCFTFDIILENIIY